MVSDILGVENYDDDLYTPTAAMAVLVSNDILYMHHLAYGVDFDKCHSITQEYYEKINEEVDYLFELAVEHGASICNATNALDYVENYAVENLSEYDYTTTISVLYSKLSIYIASLEVLREESGEDDVQSKLDDMIRYWKKELNYKISRRV